MSHLAPPDRPLAIVTGGSRGIGAATARSRAARGNDVLITYTSPPDAAKEVARVHGNGGAGRRGRRRAG